MYNNSSLCGPILKLYFLSHSETDYQFDSVFGAKNIMCSIHSVHSFKRLEGVNKSIVLLLLRGVTKFAGKKSRCLNIR